MLPSQSPPFGAKPVNEVNDTPVHSALNFWFWNVDPEEAVSVIRQVAETLQPHLGGLIATDLLKEARLTFDNPERVALQVALELVLGTVGSD
jgi:hypothetical protein